MERTRRNNGMERERWIGDGAKSFFQRAEKGREIRHRRYSVEHFINHSRGRASDLHNSR